MKIEMNETILSNLLVFLDRVEIKGLREVAVMNQILDVLQSPTEDHLSQNTVSVNEKEQKK